MSETGKGTAQIATLVRTVEKPRPRTWLSPAAWQLSNEVFVDKMGVQAEWLTIWQKEEGRREVLLLLSLFPLV